MDFVKQYIIQSISTASSNLRLSNQRIEVIALLKETIQKSKDLQHDLNQMKKITELSKLAIKLSEMIQYFSDGNVDFLKVSDRFKEHSFILIKELSSMLDVVNPYTFKQTLDRLIEPEKVVEIILESEENNSSISETKTSSLESVFRTDIKLDYIPSDGTDSIHNESTDTKLRIDDNSKSFSSFESTILSPIKSIDSMLGEMNINSEIPVQVDEYSRLMKSNGELSTKNGFEILSQMHGILAQGLMLLKNKSLVPSKEVIESLRACLIVIVAVVKTKEIDITNYLNRAEVFGKFLRKLNTEENK